MRRWILLIGACAAATLAARASWYWPFGDDEDKKPPRLHRLMEPANDLIERAEDAAYDGKAEEALKLYQEAVNELARVARENPERAETPEFAPLRNKIATTQAAIDSLRFAQVRNGAKSVAVTDTSALERKLKIERGEIKEEKKVEKKKVEEKKVEEKKVEEKKVEEKKVEEKKVEEKKVEEKKEAPKAVEAKKPAAEKPPAILDYKGKIKLALKEIRAKDFAAADILLEELVAERPNDLNTLILRAAAQTGLEHYYAARRTLEKAHRAHPKSHLPCYNLAYLMFKIPGDNLEDARQYYELGRGLGGPRDLKLEAKFK